MPRQRSGGGDDGTKPDGNRTVGPENPDGDVTPAGGQDDTRPANPGRDVTQATPDNSVPPRIGDEMRGHIGERLRAHYDAVAQEPVPDRFLDLLAQLEAGSDSDEADPKK